MAGPFAASPRCDPLSAGSNGHVGGNGSLEIHQTTMINGNVTTSGAFLTGPKALEVDTNVTVTGDVLANNGGIKVRATAVSGNVDMPVLRPLVCHPASRAER